MSTNFWNLYILWKKKHHSKITHSAHDSVWAVLIIFIATITYGLVPRLPTGRQQQSPHWSQNKQPPAGSSSDQACVLLAKWGFNLIQFTAS